MKELTNVDSEELTVMEVLVVPTELPFALPIYWYFTGFSACRAKLLIGFRNDSHFVSSAFTKINTLKTRDAGGLPFTTSISCLHVASSTVFVSLN